MISQQLLGSPVPLCDESLKLPLLNVTSEEEGGFYCDERGVGRVRPGKVNKIN